MRLKAPPLRLQSAALQCRLDLILQMLQLWVSLDPNPQRGAAASLAECAESGERKREAAGAQSGQRNVDLLGYVAGRFPDDPQRQMVIRRGPPPSAGQAGSRQNGQTVTQRPGQIEGDEQPHSNTL